MTEITSQVKPKCIANCDAIPVKLCPAEHHGSCCFFTLKGFGLASRHENALSYLLPGYEIKLGHMPLGIVYTVIGCDEANVMPRTRQIDGSTYGISVIVILSRTQFSWY